MWGGRFCVFRPTLVYGRMINMLNNFLQPDQPEPAALGTMEGYTYWLQTTLDDYAARCSYHARTYEEAPPYELSDFHAVLSAAWDGLQIIERQDVRYKNMRPYAHEYVGKENGYLLYLKQVIMNSSYYNPKWVTRVINKLPAAERKLLKAL